MQHFVQSVTSSGKGEAQVEAHAGRLRLGLVVLLLGATFLMGGSSRGDVASLLFLRPLAAAIFVLAVMTALPSAWRRAPMAVAIGAAAPILCLIHLVPLPPWIWMELPGRQIAVEVYRTSGLPLPWHPLTLAPQHTWNAFFFLLTPLSALMLTLSLSPGQVRQLLAVLVGFCGLNAVMGALQSLGIPSLHLYEITNRDFAVGLFANRNHAAVAFACTLPLLGIYARLRRTQGGGWNPMLPLAVVAALLLVPLILLTGSRAGLAWAGLAVPLMLWVHGRLSNSSRLATALPWLVGLAVTCIAALFVLGNRAPALLRLAETGGASELRLNAIPVIWQAIRDHWPFGSGLGSFVEIYGIYEPSDLLGVAYLNHAHNDYLELLLTGGLPAVVIVAAAAASLVRAATYLPGAGPSTDDPGWARAGLSIIIILALASIVDYPVRTPILAVLLAISAALVARRRPLPADRGAAETGISAPEPAPFVAEGRILVGHRGLQFETRPCRRVYELAMDEDPAGFIGVPVRARGVMIGGCRLSVQAIERVSQGRSGQLPAIPR